jgi:hypothetical protein
VNGSGLGGQKLPEVEVVVEIQELNPDRNAPYWVKI